MFRNPAYKNAQVNFFINNRKYKNNEKAVSDLIDSLTASNLKNLLYPVDLNKILFNLFVESVNLFEVNLGYNVIKYL